MHLLPLIPPKPLAGLVGLLLLPFSAFGSVGLSINQAFPSGATVGATNLAGALTLTNTSTAPNTTGNMTISGIRLMPGCGSTGTVANLCSTPDPGVFSYVTATGRTGTAFAGLTFTFSVINASTGETQLVPTAPTILGPPGSATASGAIDFTLNVVRSPAIDVSPSPGVQTWHNVGASGTLDGLTATVIASVMSTISKAQPSLSATTQGTILLGGSISNTATVSGAVNPTGTITFTLFGPNDSSCGGAAIFTSIKPLDVGGTATSGAYTPSTPGIYRWVVSYSGDANNNAATRACNATGSLVNVEFLVIRSIQKATNNVTILFNGIAGHTYQVQYRNTLTPADSWTPVPASFVADGMGNFPFNDSTTAPTKFYRGSIP